jgi:hypothetical protein
VRVSIAPAAGRKPRQRVPAMFSRTRPPLVASRPTPTTPAAPGDATMKLRLSILAALSQPFSRARCRRSPTPPPSSTSRSATRSPSVVSPSTRAVALTADDRRRRGRERRGLCRPAGRAHARNDRKPAHRDVETAFSLTDFTPQPDGLPLNLEHVCQWTCMCPPVGDVHPNETGYGVIAHSRVTLTVAPPG